LPSTAKFLADKHGVSEKTIKRDAIFAQIVDKIVSEYGDEEVRRKLLGADVKMTQGTARVLLRMSLSERKTAIRQLIGDNCSSPPATTRHPHIPVSDDN